MAEPRGPYRSGEFKIVRRATLPAEREDKNLPFLEEALKRKGERTYESAGQLAHEVAQWAFDDDEPMREQVRSYLRRNLVQHF